MAEVSPISPLMHANGSAVTLEDILITAELAHRRSRVPDYASENRALVALAREMAIDPHNLLQMLVDTAVELCGAGTAGLSVLKVEANGEYLSWETVSGVYTPYIENALAYRKVRQTEERLQASLHEKEVLLKEIHHRVKNNLQVIASLLYLQSDQLRDPEDIALFEETQNRVRSMALIHESLYRTGDLVHFNFAHYVESVSTYLFQSYAVGVSDIHLHTELDEIAFDIDTAIPCGLILNELLTNALKYAFPDGRSGDIHVTLRAEAQHVTLSVRDTGIGFPQGVDFRNTESLGLQLVGMLTDQLGGR